MTLSMTSRSIISRWLPLLLCAFMVASVVVSVDTTVNTTPAAAATTESIVCESNGGRIECDTGKQIQSFWEGKRLSATPCSGNSFTEGSKIVVTNGCRARFDFIPADTVAGSAGSANSATSNSATSNSGSNSTKTNGQSNTGAPSTSPAVTAGENQIVCESTGGRVECDTGKRIKSFWEAKRLSAAPCSGNSSNEGSKIVVTNGCRALFQYIPAEISNTSSNSASTSGATSSGSVTTDSIEPPEPNSASTASAGDNTIPCRSNGERVECDTGKQIKSFWEAKRESAAPCSGNSFAEGTKIVVINGCKALFEYIPVGASTNTSGSSEIFGLAANTSVNAASPSSETSQGPLTIPCRSNGGEQWCNTNKKIKNFWEHKRHTSESCAGTRAQGTHIIVKDRCDAIFGFTVDTSSGSTASSGAQTSGSQTAGSQASGTQSSGTQAAAEIAQRCEGLDLSRAGFSETKFPHCGTLERDRILFSDPAGGNRIHSSSKYAPKSTKGKQHGSIGAFRVKCFFSHFDYKDPVVRPTPEHAHLHAFFGAPSVDNFSMPDDLRDLTSSTCLGGTINNSSYWVPALMSKKNGAPIAPEHAFIYYKTGYHLEPFGESSDKKIHNVLPDIGTIARRGEQAANPFTCKKPKNHAVTNKDIVRVDEFGPNDQTDLWRSHSAPTIAGTSCRAGDLLVMNIRFNQCWDSRENDNNNVTFTVAPTNGCGNPNNSADPIKTIPKIEYQVYYRLRVDSADLRLSSDNPSAKPAQTSGESIHGDWLNGWNKDFSDGDNGWIEKCIKASFSCSNVIRPDGGTDWVVLGLPNEDPQKDDLRRSSVGGLIH